MSSFHSGLTKIFGRSAAGKVVLIVESPEWAAQSPPSVHPPIELGGHSATTQRVETQAPRHAPVPSRVMVPSSLDDSRIGVAHLSIEVAGGITSLSTMRRRVATAKSMPASVPLHRWERSHVSAANYGTFLLCGPCLDLQMFKIAPTAASYMDPQNIMLLQNAFAIVRSPAYTSREKNTGVFVGILGQPVEMVFGTNDG